MSNFVSLKIKDIIRETADANTIVFEKPAGNEFDYLAGQYLTLRMDVNGEDQRRAYSLCSSPLTDADLAVTVKRVDGGRVSNYVADHLRAGDELLVFPPMGNFKISPDATASKHYILFGGGSGITPLMSIIKTVLKAEPGSKISLLYGNRSEDDIIFYQSLKELTAESGGRLRVFYALDTAPEGWSGISGRYSRQNLMPIVQDLLAADQLSKAFYMCGPAGFMAEVVAALGFLGIPEKDIQRESFTAPLPKTDTDKSTVVGKRGTYTIKVTIDGTEREVEVKENTTILEAVINAGGDPPYACQMGVCCTCRAKLTSGQVEMEEDEGLSDAEIEDGYILTCQSHPLSDDCVLEYM